MRVIPKDADTAILAFGERRVRLSNLRKPFWPEYTKGDLIQYYFDVSSVLLPHIENRPMVMRRYPHGIFGEAFFMKRAPTPRPDWIATCAVEHKSGNLIDFPLINDLAALMWVINLGCIDLNPWYARCDDWERPDFVNFDLDPGEDVDFAAVKEAALLVRDGLRALGMESWAKTTGSRGIHVYVPIVRGPKQHVVWEFAKNFASALALQHRSLLTVVYAVAARPKNRVHVDFNQNALGRTLASVYSPRPRPRAPVSTPLTWRELLKIELDDFRIDNLPARIRERGDLWAPLLDDEQRFDLAPLLAPQKKN